MPTKTYEKSYNVGGLATKVVVTAIETDTSWSLTNVKVSIQKGSSKFHLKLQYAKYFYENSSTPTYYNIVDITGTPSACGFSSDGNYWTRTEPGSLSFSKSKAAVSRVDVIVTLASTLSSTTTTLGSTTSIDIPKWTSYSIVYNANGGTNAPSSQIRYFGEDIVLTSLSPTREGYKFASWNTSSDGTGTSYYSGSKYSDNKSLYLYAQWQSAAKPPKIYSMSVIRCDENRTQNDLGTYCLLRVGWSVDTESAGLADNTGVISGTVKAYGTSTSRDISFDDDTIGGTSNTSVALIDSVDTDTQYVITVTVANSKIGTGQSEALLTTRGDILTKANFIMDFRAGGKALGIGTAAPKSGLEIGWDTKIDGDIVADNLKYIEKWDSNLFEVGSYVNLSGADGHKFGRLCCVRLTFRAKTSISATNERLGYLVSEFCPIEPMKIKLTDINATVSTSGRAVYFYPSSTVSSGTTFSFTLVFMSAS